MEREIEREENIYEESSARSKRRDYNCKRCRFVWPQAHCLTEWRAAKRRNCKRERERKKHTRLTSIQTVWESIAKYKGEEGREREEKSVNRLITYCGIGPGIIFLSAFANTRRPRTRETNTQAVTLNEFVRGNCDTTDPPSLSLTLGKIANTLKSQLKQLFTYKVSLNYTHIHRYVVHIYTYTFVYECICIYFGSHES